MPNNPNQNTEQGTLFEAGIQLATGIGQVAVAAGMVVVGSHYVREMYGVTQRWRDERNNYAEGLRTEAKYGEGEDYAS